MSTANPLAAPAERPLPGALRVGLSRAKVEVLNYVRNPIAVIFTFALPIVLLVFIGAMYSGTVAGTGVSVKKVLVAGILAAGIMSTTFSGLAIGIAAERSEGTLHRLAGTPMPRAAYFLGKLINIYAVTLLEVLALLVVGTTLYHLSWPATAGHWVALGWVVLLGTTACATLGIAWSRMAPNARVATPVVQLPFLSMQFISGVFVPFSSLPKALQVVAALFPLKWLAQGLRSVFLPAAFQHAEVAGSWELGRVAVVLGAWTVGAFAVALFTFTWGGPEE